jgi:hypothetical protein
MPAHRTWRWSRAAPGEPHHGRLPCHRWQGEGSQKRPAQCRMRGAGSLRRLGRRCAVTHRGGMTRATRGQRPVPWARAGRRRIGAGHPRGCVGATLRRPACARPAGSEGKAVRGSKSAGGAVPLIQLTWGCCPLFSSAKRDGEAGHLVADGKGSALRLRVIAALCRWCGKAGQAPASLMAPYSLFPASPRSSRELPSGCGGRAGFCGGGRAKSQAQQGFGDDALNFGRVHAASINGASQTEPLP